jgi:hypothetical protein
MNCQLIAGEALGLTGNPTGLMTADLVFKARSARASSPMNLLGPSDRKPSLGSLLEVVHLGSERTFAAIGIQGQPSAQSATISAMLTFAAQYAREGGG